MEKIEPIENQIRFHTEENSPFLLSSNSPSPIYLNTEPNKENQKDSKDIKKVLFHETNLIKKLRLNINNSYNKNILYQKNDIKNKHLFQITGKNLINSKPLYLSKFQNNLKYSFFNNNYQNDINKKKNFNFYNYMKFNPNNNIYNKVDNYKLGILNRNNLNFFNITQNNSSILTQYRSESLPGFLFDQNPKINQDSFLELPNIFGNKNFHIFAVFDGHGENGHLVSQFISNNYKQLILNNEDLINLSDDTNKIYNFIKLNNFEFIYNSINYIEELLYKQQEFDISNSGSTLNMIYIIGIHILTVNIGDSRSLIGKDKKEFLQLTKDNKLTDAEEYNRIIQCNGEIKRNNPLNLNEPLRVFVKDKDFPGLSMSRSIGDTIAKEIGVISTPEIQRYRLYEECKFIILASDGLWEFLTNKKINKYVKKFYKKNDIEGCVKYLINKAVIKWNKNEINNRDDITVIVLFFNRN